MELQSLTQTLTNPQGILPEPAATLHQETKVLLILIGLFIPLFYLCLRAISLQLRYMDYQGLRRPVITIFMGPIFFSVLTLISLFLDSLNDLILQGFEKLLLTYILYNYFMILHEIVYFESLFKADAVVKNMPIFISMHSNEGYGYEGMGQGDMNLIGNHARNQSRNQFLSNRQQKSNSGLLKETLLNIQYDRGLEEEKILNAVFPTSNMEKHILPIKIQKQKAIDEELFEIGTTPSCMSHWSTASQSYESPSEVSNIRRGLKITIISLCLFVILKTVSEYILILYGYQKIDHLNIAMMLEVLELIGFGYLIFNFYIFVNKLSVGTIKDYQPKTKFYWFIFLILVIVYQKFIIHQLWYKNIFYENRNIDKTIESTSYLSENEAQGFIKCLELLIFTIGIVRHFQIKQDDINDQIQDFDQNNIRYLSGINSPKTNDLSFKQLRSPVKQREIYK